MLKFRYYYSSLNIIQNEDSNEFIDESFDKTPLPKTQNEIENEKMREKFILKMRKEMNKRKNNQKLQVSLFSI